MMSFPKIESTGQESNLQLARNPFNQLNYLCFVIQMRTGAVSHGVRDSMKGRFYAPTAPAILKIVYAFLIYLHTVPNDYATTHKIRCQGFFWVFAISY